MNLLNALKVNYENLGDEENAVKWAKEVEKFVINSNHNYPKEQEYLLGSYDTRARFGDFRAYCIALEWKRPIDKQFFLPRKRILEKHGLIQAMQDVADGKLDFLFVSLAPRVGKSSLGLFFLTFIQYTCGFTNQQFIQIGQYSVMDTQRLLLNLFIMKF